MIVVIPARLQSKRVPGKLLVDIAGKSLLQRCWESAQIAANFAKGCKVYIASSDTEIINHAKQFGAEVVVTSESPINGTERVAEAVNLLKIPSNEVVINCQGDMFYFPPTLFSSLKRTIYEGADLVTAVSQHCEPYSLDDYHVVKAYVGRYELVHHFSRVQYRSVGVPPVKAFAHVGIYGAKKHKFDYYTEYGPVHDELTWGLEQLRWQDAFVAVIIRNYPLKIDEKSDILYVKSKCEALGI
jgi:3-deoxy-manno-octulosonate cytidylyltransferase (CMP-KDO synthetase)